MRCAATRCAATDQDALAGVVVVGVVVVVVCCDECGRVVCLTAFFVLSRTRPEEKIGSEIRGQTRESPELGSDATRVSRARRCECATGQKTQEREKRRRGTRPEDDDRYYFILFFRSERRRQDGALFLSCLFFPVGERGGTVMGRNGKEEKKKRGISEGGPEQGLWGGRRDCGLKIGQRQDSGRAASYSGKKTRSGGQFEVEEVEARGLWCSTGTRDGLTGRVSSSLSRGATVPVVPKLCCSFGGVACLRQPCPAGAPNAGLATGPLMEMGQIRHGWKAVTGRPGGI